LNRCSDPWPILDRLDSVGAVNRRLFRVVAVVPFDEEDESPFVGLLQVEAA
jgi:hypothetical protein